MNKEKAPYWLSTLSAFLVLCLIFVLVLYADTTHLHSYLKFLIGFLLGFPAYIFIRIIIRGISLIIKKGWKAKPK